MTETSSATPRPVPVAARAFIVRRAFTVLALLAVTVTIVAITVLTSGSSYSKVEPLPFDDLRHLVNRVERKPVPTQIVALIIMPIIGNIFLFVPWGFLTFIVFYSVDRPTIQTYILTILLGFTLTVSIEAWQYFLPSRVADINDVIWNTAGTIIGAVLGHMRLRVRVEFE